MSSISKIYVLCTLHNTHKCIYKWSTTATLQLGTVVPRQYRQNSDNGARNRESAFLEYPLFFHGPETRLTLLKFSRGMNHWLSMIHINSTRQMMESVRNMNSLEHFLLSSSILQQQCQGHRPIGENGETCSLRGHHTAIPCFVGMIVLTSQGIMQAPATLLHSNNLNY